MTLESPRHHELRTMPKMFGIEERPYKRFNFNDPLWVSMRDQFEEAQKERDRINKLYNQKP